MEYIKRVLEQIKQKDSDQPEFIQAVEDVLESLTPVIEAHPEYEKLAILERLVEPERTIMFKVPWMDDNGNVHVNRGYRVQFSSAIGPYKGGLRFHPSVYLGIIKFLGFEQVFKNALTTLPLGGGKGGADFDPQGKSDNEIMRFCQSFMTELYRHIGPNTDVPAGDIGVGAREIGYLYGEYRRLRGTFENGVLTGKPLVYGGSLIRPEATGYGAIYFTQKIFEHCQETIAGKTFALSGFGNVSWGAASKITELGGKVVTISGPDGYIYDADGLNQEKIDYMLEMRAANHNQVKYYADKFNVPFFPGQNPWNEKVDVIMPCATQNEIGIAEAKQIVANNIKYVVEVSNMPSTTEAVHYLTKHGVIVAPSKAVNAGGVAVSALEMSQNSMRYSWSAEEVDAKLKTIMVSIHDASKSASERYGFGYDLIKGANIAGFEKVVAAMLSQGIY